MTTEEFINRAKAIHGDKYDYSITVLKRMVDDIEYICPIHGVVKQPAKSHLRGSECIHCSYTNRGFERRIKNRNRFVERARKVHSDRYDYSKVEYVDSKTDVIIGCPIHGDFKQPPSTHLAGRGCYDCGRVTTGMKRRKSKEKFIEDAKKVHGDKYTYESVNYVNSSTIVQVTCRKHGDFPISPRNLLSGKGCPKCYREKTSQRLRKPQEVFIEQCTKVHNGKYDYSQVEYTGKENRITIICPKHGAFPQIAGHHLRGSGCPHCMRSLGEEKIAKFLTQEGIPYVFQHLVYNENLFCSRRFMKIDFYLHDFNLFIEFNGKQHYEAIDYFGGESSFEIRQERDIALKQYCKEHKIKLIEISYKDFNNIEKILTKVL